MGDEDKVQDQRITSLESRMKAVEGEVGRLREAQSADKLQLSLEIAKLSSDVREQGRDVKHEAKLIGLLVGAGSSVVTGVIVGVVVWLATH